MSKISDEDVRGASQEQVNFNDAVRILLNNGKYQTGVLSAAPTHTGRAGESILVLNGTAGSLYFNTVDGGTVWTEVLTFLALTA